MKRRQWIAGAFAGALLTRTVFLPAAFAQTSPRSGREALKAFVRGASGASGRFTQTVLGKDGKVVDGPIEGTFAFKRPGRFVWDVRTPYPQKIVADAKNIYVWDPDLNQVTVKRLTAAVSSTPASILFGETDVEKSFALEDLPAGNGKEGLLWVRATPRREDLTYEFIDLGFDAGGKIAAMRLKDHFGQTTELQLSGIVVDDKLPDDQFVFAIPEGADVLADDTAEAGGA